MLFTLCNSSKEFKPRKENSFCDLIFSSNRFMSKVGAYFSCRQGDHSREQYRCRNEFLFGAKNRITPVPINKCTRTAFYSFSFTMNRKSRGATRNNNWFGQTHAYYFFGQGLNDVESLIHLFFLFRIVDIPDMSIIGMDAFYNDPFCTRTISI